MLQNITKFLQIFLLPARLPDIAASRVETWNNLRASLTWLSLANGCNCIFASDSDILIIASNCLNK